MDFTRVLSRVVSDLDKNGVRYALIGGMAMAMREINRFRSIGNSWKTTLASSTSVTN